MEAAVLEVVWKALADPTRRAMLDALRDGPKTTGQLCAPFELSRFAVMKHLTVLVEAGLVVVRRSGRERWNHLNVIPIQQIHQRWVKPYETLWANGLLDLQSHIENPERGAAMGDKNGSKIELGVTQIEMEIPIAAKPSRVWEALVGETTRWWSKDFYSNPATKGFHIEPHLGGKVFEDSGNGTGLTWYTVLGIEIHRSLLLQGWLTADFGGPAATLLRLQLDPSGKGTTLKLSDTIFGRIGDAKASETREGWSILIEKGFKKYVESSRESK